MAGLVTGPGVKKQAQMVPGNPHAMFDVAGGAETFLNKEARQSSTLPTRGAGDRTVSDLGSVE
jgi:hypothetical protein